MKRWLVTICVVWAASAQAETVALRSGEHDGFTRIVVDAGVDVDWALGRDDRGYVLRLAGAAISFDISQVFRAITRDRIAGLAAPSGRGELHLAVTCACHAAAFRTQAGSIVIDIRNGPPDPAGPFESALPPVAPRTGPDAASQPPADAASTAGVDDADDALPASARSGTVANAHSGLPPPILPLGLGGRPGAVADSGGKTLLPDPALTSTDRVTAAQSVLLDQFARAAAQGLIDVDDHSGLVRPATEHPQAAPVSPNPPDLPEPDDTGDRVRIDTSLDRALAAAAPPRPVTDEGEICPDEQLFALHEWTDDRPAALQIAQGRSNLVGEFDRPDPVAVQTLARLYLSLSFGAEAAAVLQEFDEATGAAVVLNGMAQLMDGDAQGNPGEFAQWSDCANAVAFWSMLSGSNRVGEAGRKAALRTFALYPPAVQAQVGTRLSRAFLDAGDGEGARVIANTLARSGAMAGPAGSVVGLAIGLSDGEPPSDSEAAVDLALSNDPLAPEATLSVIRGQLVAGLPVSEALAAHAEALAFSMQGEAAGDGLAGAAALGFASAGAFDKGQEIFLALQDRLGEPVLVADLSDYALMLADGADDATFLRLVFGTSEAFERVPLHIEAWLALAQRLSSLGFHDAAAGLAAVHDPASARPHLVQAHLQRGDAAAALATVAPGDAPALQAQVSAMAGDYAAAVATLEQSGQQGLAAELALQGGLWGAAAALADGKRKAAIDALMAPATLPGGEGLRTSLAATRAILERASRRRDAVDTLISGAGS